MVANIKKWRHVGKCAQQLLRTTRMESDSRKRPPKESEQVMSRKEVLEQLVWTSPKLQEIFRVIYESVLPKEKDRIAGPGKYRFRKIMITEDQPLIAWFYEVLHAQLNDKERTEFADRFNRPPGPPKCAHDPRLSHLVVGGILYNVAAQGTNLDKDCNFVIVSTCGPTVAAELQACLRVWRVSQCNEVTILRLCVENSRDTYREAQQIYKAMVEMAANGETENAIERLFECLNKHQGEVDMWKKTAEGVNKCREAWSHATNTTVHDTMWKGAAEYHHAKNCSATDPSAPPGGGPPPSGDPGVVSNQDGNREEGKTRPEEHGLGAVELALLSPNHTWTTSDLDNPLFFERGLRLLQWDRLRIKGDTAHIHPYVNYKKLPQENRDPIKERVAQDVREHQLEDYRQQCRRQSYGDHPKDQSS
ncbi:hypothetical protein LTR37_003705 [Vermiconidia calcicola]|uniref:Uncharacterized protein n=1 Tax=Vermiconidia calcicola TaxID=1690605 RepID=A0ACC3NPB2_9PEZI|nr:hypothetical protein LTR37_003705 [Vermiconidia calcicola]